MAMPGRAGYGDRREFVGRIHLLHPAMGDGIALRRLPVTDHHYTAVVAHGEKSS